MTKNILLSATLLSLFCFSQKSFSQTKKDSSKISISGYADAYYAYYTDSVGDGNYQKFPSVSPRSNQFGLNCANFTIQYDAEKVRGVATLQFGDIPRSTWSGTFNNILEAHVGIKLCEKMWVDAGFFRTHFGTEGLFPKENICSSISVNTFMEPYFESGLRLNYMPNSKLTINLYALNGYNMYEDNNQKKSFGALVTYSLNDKINFGYSNYIGDDTPTGDTVTHNRIHNNLFVNFQLKKFKAQVGGDYCMQQNADIAFHNQQATMMSGVASLKFQCCKKDAVYGRFEYFNDPQGFMSGTYVDANNILSGLYLWGATLGFEYTPTSNTYIRLEGRQIQTDTAQEIFHWKNENTNQRMELMIHTGISF